MVCDALVYNYTVSCYQHRYYEYYTAAVHIRLSLNNYCHVSLGNGYIYITEGLLQTYLGYFSSKCLVNHFTTQE